jgi:hypothetical protein
MWTCPKCGHKFVNRNQSHSCGHYTVEDFLRGKSDLAKKLFNDFLSSYRTIGPFELHPVKTRVALLTKMRFCSINKIGQDYIDCHLVLREPYKDAPCFHKIDNLADKFFIHHFRIRSKKEINAGLKRYMRLAYEVGERKHVKP